MQEQLQLIVNFLNENFYQLAIFWSIYFIFKNLSKSDLKRESSFDIALWYVFLILLILKIYYFAVNYRNFASLNEFFLNFNFTDDALLIIILSNFVLSFLFFKFFKFSLFKILDTLNLNLFLVFFAILVLKFGWSYLWVGLWLFSSYALSKKLISGFLSFFLIFTFLTYNVVTQTFPNSLIFYLIVNIICALFIYKRLKYMDNYLPADFVEMCKQKLITRKKEIEEMLKMEEQELNVDRSGVASDSDPIDEAYEIASREEDLEEKGMLQTIQSRINKALKKIDEGKYGVDEKTGERIDKARLEQFPEAETN
jgi:RNA polymerase-binding transcription factor DksA